VGYSTKKGGKPSLLAAVVALLDKVRGVRKEGMNLTGGRMEGENRNERAPDEKSQIRLKIYSVRRSKITGGKKKMVERTL